MPSTTGRHFFCPHFPAKPHIPVSTDDTTAYERWSKPMTRNTFHPGFEALERRDCPTVTLLNGTLTIVGTNAADRILITQDDLAKTVTVEDTITSNGVETITTSVVDGRALRK